MKILLLCEGDAETHDSWSGISRSVVLHLRAAGHQVIPADTDLYGLTKWFQLLLSFSLNRRRWWVKYHLGGSAFRARSRVASRHLDRWKGEVDVILQFGATFEPLGRGSLPLVLYCDSNIAMAQLGSATGLTEASSLTAQEIEQVRIRETRVYAQSDAIMTLSEFLRNTFVSKFGLEPDRIVAVGAGPNLDQDGSPAAPPPPSSPPTILFVGRQFDRKGGPMLLRAFQSVRRQVPQARLVIVGPHSIAEELGEGVEFLGFLNKDDPRDASRLRKAYEDAHVFCLPTRFEPFGVAFLEAMRFGIPCVGPDAWAVPEMVVHGQTGVLVPADDEGALAQALSGLLLDRELALSMGRLGRERAETLFSWTAVTSRMAPILARAIDRGEASTNAL
jgi:alpha-maltose-1-phosphate synthase